MGGSREPPSRVSAELPGPPVTMRRRLFRHLGEGFSGCCQKDGVIRGLEGERMKGHMGMPGLEGQFREEARRDLPDPLPPRR